MFHSPVEPELRDPERGGPAVDPDVLWSGGDKRVRDLHLRVSQASTNALFAPYFALAAAAYALLVAWGMAGSAPIAALGCWLLLVMGSHYWRWTDVAREAQAADNRESKPQPGWRAIAVGGGLALIWVSFPVYSFAAQPAETQLVIAGAIGSLIIAAIGLAAVPSAALAWIATMTAGLCVAHWFTSAELDPKLTLTIIGGAAVAILGVGRLTRWTYSQLKDTAAVNAQSEAVRSLLHEYEHRGVGWLWQIDSENRVVYISSRMTTLLGRSAHQLIGHSLPATLGGNAVLGRTLLTREPFANLEMELPTRRGARWISLSGDPILDGGGAFMGFRGVGSDITEVRKTQERLTNLANMDVLSGLPNRGRVRQLLGEALSIAQATNVPCAIMFLDLDGFKPVNDTFGHPKGDAVLKSVAQRLVKEVGAAGHVGRMGGDEFAIVIRDGQSRKAVETLARRLVDAVAQPYILDKAEIRIGVSIGCAFGPIDGQSVDDLIQKADLALYQAKGQGRGTCCYFHIDMQSVAEHKMRLERDLKAAITGGQLRLLYQPLIRASDQSLQGFEALVRWHHPERGMVPPNEFIPLAEETGLIIPLGEWVVQEACRAAASWPEHITVAVNLSARQLVLKSLPATISGILGRHRLQANRLELEVTESVFLEDSEGSLDVLKRLRALGVGIALDDFGTGYSSLGYLNKAVFHKLKIDGSFVREAGSNRETVAIIQSIVQLAKSFRMTITAEGVETADDFTRMRDLGCHQIQGYLFGRPMPFERASELVHGTPSRLSA